MTKDEIILELTRALVSARITLIQAHNCLALNGVYCPELQYTEQVAEQINDAFRRVWPSLLHNEDFRRAFDFAQVPVGENSKSQ